LEISEILVVESKLLLNIAGKHLFTSQGIATTVNRWGE